MQNVINSLAVLSFLGTVLLLFGFSAMLRTLRELQGALLRLQAAEPAVTMTRSVARFASADGEPTFVLVVSERCQNCRDRVRRLTELTSLPRVLLLCASGCDDWTAGKVETIVDSDLLGSLGIGATPALVRYAPDGTEEWRRVVGSDEDLEEQLAEPKTLTEV